VDIPAVLEPCSPYAAACVASGSGAGSRVICAEVVSAAFRAHHRDQNEIVSDEERARARVAHDCLSSWHIVPGTEAGGSLDGDRLSAWVDEARLLVASVRVAIGDQQIGRVLAFAPAEVGGIWPPTGVRALVEREASDDLEIRFIMGARSQRDVFTKALTAAGARRSDGWRHIIETAPMQWPCRHPERQQCCEESSISTSQMRIARTFVRSKET
jgi:hypothetical protein